MSLGVCARCVSRASCLGSSDDTANYDVALDALLADLRRAPARSVVLRNGFTQTLMVLNASVDSAAAELVSFTPGIVRAGHSWSASVVRFVATPPGVPAPRLQLLTNASLLSVPLQLYDGRLWTHCWPPTSGDSVPAVLATQRRNASATPSDAALELAQRAPPPPYVDYPHRVPPHLLCAACCLVRRA